MTTYTARWVLPVAGPPLERGTVTVDGDRIAAVEPRGVRAADVDLGNAAVVPGLVNAHTHLDLSGARGRTPPTDAEHFTDWLRTVIAYRRSRTPAEVQADVRAGLAECLAAGTTLIGDIASEGQSWDAIADSTIRAVVFREVIGITEERVAEQRLAMIRWESRTRDMPDCRKGVSPHAPYSVQGTAYKTSPGDNRPHATHLAESPAEVELVVNRTGAFVDFLSAFGIWLPELIAPSFEKIVHRQRHAPVSIFAHCNYLSPAVPFGPNQSVVYCPRTHAAFGHPPHPFRDFLARDVRVCLGTDGLTSNPDLDILAEARFVAAKYPDFPGDTLLRMVTLGGAEALGWADECGSLEAGKSADFVAVPLPDRDGEPHGLLFGEDCGSRRTMFRGEWRDAQEPGA